MRFGLARLVFFVVLAWAAADVGFGSYREDLGVGLIWPLTGVALWWVCTSTRRTVVLDLVLLNAVCAATLLLDGAAPGIAAMAGLQVTSQVGVSVLVLRRLAPGLWGCGGDRPLGSLSDLGAFLLAALVGAVAGSALRSAGLGLIPTPTALDVALVFTRNLCWLYLIGAAVLQLGPAAGRQRRHWPGGEIGRTEIGLILAAFVLTHLVVFTEPASLPITFVLMLPILWAALRLAPPVASLLALASGVVAVAATLGGFGVFAGIADPRTGALLVQAFAMSTMTISLTVSLATHERMLATARLRRSERRAEERAMLLSATLERIREAILVVDEEHRVVMSNPAVRDLGLHGVVVDEGERIELAGAHDAGGDLVPHEEQPHVRALRGEEVVGEELHVPDGRGGRRVLEVSASPLPQAEGTRRALVVVRDVTPAREREDALAAFAGVVAHDLSNPLAVVSGWADAFGDLLEDGPVDAPTGRPILERIRSASGQMRDFIDDLLAYTVARDQAVQWEDLDLTALAEDVARLRREDTRRPDIRVAPGMRARGDAVLVRQVLDNLLGNAVKYTAADVRPVIDVAAAPAGDLVRVSVTDNGLGVPESLRDRIFETFVRAHEGSAGGTGIGLGICREVVRRHGGTIEVAAGPDGVGSRFSFTLPPAEDLPVERPPGPGGALPASATTATEPAG